MCASSRFAIFIQALICLFIPLSWGLIEPFTNPQGEVNLQQLAYTVNSLENLVQNLTSEIISLKKKQDAVVSFKAYISHDTVVYMNSTVVFDNVEHNAGNGYDPSTGMFHAPIAGIYTFSALMDTIDDGDSDYALMKEGVMEMFVTLLSSFDAKSMTSTLRVAQGSDVFIRKTFDKRNPRLRGGMWNRFSGHLLRAD